MSKKTTIKKPLPCPFCGGKTEWTYIPKKLAMPEFPNGYWSISCHRKNHCHVFPICSDESKAVALKNWNERSPVAAQLAIDRARKIIGATTEGKPMSSTAKKSGLQSLQDRIEKFQKEKFPGQPLAAKFRHMRHELTELKNKPDDEMEWADVFILFLGCAVAYGFTTHNLMALAHRKMDINDKREWHAPDAHGVCHHKEAKA